MDRSLPRLVLFALAVAILGVLVVTGATSTSAFGTHNPSWDGTADFRAVAGLNSSLEVVSNVSAYRRHPANGTLAVVLSPTEPYGGDAERLRRFVADGGTLLVAEDYRSHANPLLSAVGADVRVDGRPVRDERNHERSPSMPVVDVVDGAPLADGGAPLGDDVESLVLNRGTVLTVTDGTAVVTDGETADEADPLGDDEVRVLARTSRDAYLDVDGDETLDDGETPERRPVMAVDAVGDGRVIVLSDPSVLINSMLPFGDNRALARALAADADRVLVDVSHAPGVPPLVAVLFAIRDSAVLQVAIGGVLVVLVAGRHRLWALGVRLRRRGTGSPDPTPIDPSAVASAVERDHPEWDRQRIERVAGEAVDSLGETDRDDAGDAGG